MTQTAPEPTLVALQREYGDRIVAVEPGGAEVIPEEDRHGRPIQLFWTWTSPNLEFATVFVGIISILFFGLSFWSAVSALVLGSAVGAVTHGVLSSWGPQSGRPQMVLGRSAFGFTGNRLPTAVNALVAGVGWFAVNSVSGALALSALTGLAPWLSLVIVVAAMLALATFGHNLIQAFEKYAFPVLAVIFVVGAVVVLSQTQPGTATEPIPGAWWIAFAAAFGYAAGWNPYASDYTRYLPSRTRGRTVGLFAGLGVFLSCTLLEVAGAAAVTAVGLGGDWANPTDSFTGLMPTWLGKLVLLAIALGAIAANALNMYSSGLSVAAMGFRVPSPRARAVMTVVMGLAGFVVALLALDHVDTYEGFLLVIAYWIGPWLAVVLTDRLLRRRTGYAGYETTVTDRGYRNWAGPVAWVVGVALSIVLFSNQTAYVGVLPKAVPSLGDLTFEAGFVISAVLYAVLFRPLAQPVPPAAERPADTVTA